MYCVRLSTYIILFYHPHCSSLRKGGQVPRVLWEHVTICCCYGNRRHPYCNAAM